MPVYGHHGSLSKSEREDTENRFKADSQAIRVATMTLEVGIDIGDIDLVICMDPPFSAASCKESGGGVVGYTGSLACFALRETERAS